MSTHATTFFYGLFMDPDVLSALGAAPDNLRLGYVADTGLRVGSKAYLVPSAGERTYGTVMDLRHDHLARLYSPPELAVYRPTAVTVQLLDGGAIPALCFNLADPDLSVPEDAEYAHRLTAALRRVGLPERGGRHADPTRSRHDLEGH
jgi:hypothetical protein